MLKKIIFCIIAFFVVIPKSHAVMQDFFCKELTNQIYLNIDEKSLDIVNVLEDASYGLQFKTKFDSDKGKAEFVYDSNNNLTISRITNDNFLKNEDFKINDKVIEVN